MQVLARCSLYRVHGERPNTGNVAVRNSTASVLFIRREMIDRTPLIGIYPEHYPGRICRIFSMGVIGIIIERARGEVKGISTFEV